jgi:hypothetical protein
MGGNVDSVSTSKGNGNLEADVDTERMDERVALVRRRRVSVAI